MTQIAGSGIAVDIDQSGNIYRLVSDGREIVFDNPSTYWELDGEVTAAEVAHAESDRLELHLDVAGNSAVVTVTCDQVLTVRSNSSCDHIGFSLAFPNTARFHLPERYNSCRVIDSDMTPHELYQNDLGFNFSVVEVGETWLLVHLLQSGTDRPTFTLSRQPVGFTFTFLWDPAHDAALSLHASLDEAMACYDAWLAQDIGIKKLSLDTGVPDWVQNVKLVITLDMMRSNWQIAHDYADVAGLADELNQVGCPEDTLFYLPGTNGAYDSMYPDHGPHEELGGEGGFRAMVDALHRNKFRVMLHANAWGIDPCHPEIDMYLPYVLRHEDGSYEGWQTGGTIWGGLTLPSSYKLKFRTPAIPVPLGALEADGGSFRFPSVPIPDECEALLTVGTSYRGPGTIRLTTNHRSYHTPALWFTENRAYAFPFPYLLECGENQFTVELEDDEAGELHDCWYQIRDAFTFVLGCTYPILRADTTNAEWIQILLHKIVSVVNDYSIDAVHIDATHYHRDAAILEAFRRDMPHCAISGEELDSMGDMKMYAFCQNARLELLADVGRQRERESRTYVVDQHHVEQTCGWLDKMSPVWGHLAQYIRLYPHLCNADGFVPSAKVCNIRPPTLLPRDAARLHAVLKDSKRLGYIPGLRLNYREYGIDEEAKRAIREIAQT